MKYKALLFSLFATANLFAQHPAIHFEIETDQPCQTMDYFGASDCWSMQFIGLWPQEKQNQVADWLFSTENHENGQPKGIGLSLWRVPPRPVLVARPFCVKYTGGELRNAKNLFTPRSFARRRKLRCPCCLFQL